MNVLSDSLLKRLNEWASLLHPSPHKPSNETIESIVDGTTDVAHIGSGNGRVVIKIDELPDYVIKMSHQVGLNGGKEQNQREIYVWEYIAKQNPLLVDCFASVVEWDREEALWLVMNEVDIPWADKNDKNGTASGQKYHTTPHIHMDIKQGYDPERVTADFEALKKRLVRGGANVNAGPSPTGYHDGLLKYFDYGEGIEIDH